MTKMDVLNRNLGNEKLLWSQPPRPSAAFRGENVFALCFGAVWLVLLCTTFKQPNDNSPVPKFFGYLMMIMGCIFVLGSFGGVFRALFSIYAITEKRLIIVTKFPWKIEVQSFFSQDIDFVKKIRRNNGGGDIFVKTIRVRSGKSYSDKDIGFFGVDDVDAVEDIIIKNFRI